METNEHISTKRAARILGIGYTTVLDLRCAGRIQIIANQRQKRKKISYSSIVALCDELRSRYHIRDRRSPTSLPHKDEDLLPFPLTDTLSVLAAMEILGYDSPTPIYRMIDEGFFEAYKISAASPWRISKTSLADFLQGVRNRERGGRMESISGTIAHAANSQEALNGR